MKIFKLKSVAYKNVMSVGDNLITIDLQSHHKTLITGTNGAGKSTMLEAITFALFGKPFRDIKKGQLVNSVTKKNMWVQLFMEYDGHEFQITRGQKPTVFEILRDGQLIDESANPRDFQAIFEEMIGMSYNSFKQVVVLGTAGYTPFMGLTTPNRRKLVEDLLEVTMLADMDKSNKAIIVEIQKQLNENELNIQHTQSNIKSQEEFAERQRKLSGDNITRLEGMFNECVAKITLIRDKNIELSNQIGEIILPQDVSNDIISKTRELADTESKFNSLDRVLLMYHKGGSCPTCLQQLHDSDLTDKIKSNKTGYGFAIDGLKYDISELNKKRQQFVETNQKIGEIQSQIQMNKSMAENEATRAKQIKVAIEEAKKDFVDNSDEIKKFKTDLDYFVNLKSNLLTEKNQRMMITEMLKDSGVKSTIIRRYIPTFNKQINHYLSIMEGDYTFTLDEEFNEKIRSRGREDFTYTSFSQGEKARIDLALLFTWRDVAEQISGIKINCLFLDEVADGSTDQQGVKTIQQILNEMKSSNVFIISHRDHNPTDYGQHLEMRKVGRFTVMGSTEYGE